MAHVTPTGCRVVLDCEARSISLVGDAGVVVHASFEGKRGNAGTTYFPFCCTVAILQELRGTTSSPTEWYGADDVFLQWYGRTLQRSLSPSSLHAYWRAFRLKSNETPARVDIKAPGRELTSQERKALAEKLFQESGGLFLGPPVRQHGTIVSYCPVEFVNHDDTYNDLRQKLVVWLRTGAMTTAAPRPPESYAAGTAARVPDEISRHICSFDAFMEDRSRGFVGREFVFRQLDSFLNSPDRKSGYFVIQGEPGIGKSAILSQVVRRYECDVHHFNIAAQGINTPRSFLANTGARIIRQFGLPYRELPPDFDTSGAFLATLLQKSSARLGGQQRLIIAIDALDEVATTPDASQTNVLFLPIGLPDGVFVIATTRNTHEVRLHVTDCESPRLEPDSAENARDVTAYLQSQAQRDGVREWVAQQGLSEDAFIQALLHKSAGNFMYLRHVLLAIERGRYRHTDIASLPDGLRAYYRSHWEKMRRLSPETFTSLAEPVVCVLAAAREAVSIEQVHLTTGLPSPRIRDVLRKWREFLTEERIKGVPCYRVYHATFREFLEEEVDPGFQTYNKVIVVSALKRAGGLRSLPATKPSSRLSSKTSRRVAAGRRASRKGST